MQRSEVVVGGKAEFDWRFLDMEAQITDHVSLAMSAVNSFSTLAYVISHFEQQT